MKIVLNQCFGGFSLSDDGMVHFLKQHIEKGNYYNYDIFSLKVYSCSYYFLIKKNYIDKFLKDTHGMENIDILKNIYSLPPKEKTNYIIIDNSFIKRDDPFLVSTVETLGSKRSSGDCSKLEVEEIDFDIHDYIRENDGYEEFIIHS